jgi:hypothetical protein
VGIFGRRRRDEAAATDDAPDESFPFLTAGQVIRIRSLAQQALAEHGHEVVIGPDHLVGADGTVFGLANLAAACHNAPKGEREWPEVVRTHARVVVAAVRDAVPVTELDRDDVLARTYLRAVGLSVLPSDVEDRLQYARPVVGDIVEVLVLDSPESVASLYDEDVAVFGLEQLKQAGLYNLLREPIGEVERFDVGGAQIHVVTGESVYLASKMLVMTDLLLRVFGEREYPNGVLMTVAFRNQVALHPVDGPEVVGAVDCLAQFARNGFSDSVGPVSPFTYWWHDGEFTQVTEPDGAGGVVVCVDAAFGEMLNRLLG